jgi:hypothetical protein
LLSDTVYTHQRAHRIGADTSECCPACGTADTVQHRLVSCAVSDAPSLTLPESSLASLLPIPPRRFSVSSLLRSGILSHLRRPHRGRNSAS